MKTMYFDHAATTPVDPQVLEAMLPYFGERYGNPSEMHRLGREARAAVEEARAKVPPRSAPARRRSSSPQAAPRPTTSLSSVIWRAFSWDT